MDHRQDLARRAHSDRQRVIVLTFADTEDAEAWDAAGQHLGDLVTIHGQMLDSVTSDATKPGC